MVANALKEKFEDWEWKCEDCQATWRSERYECPTCGSRNTERTLKWEESPAT